MAHNLHKQACPCTSLGVPATTLQVNKSCPRKLTTTRSLLRFPSLTSSNRSASKQAALKLKKALVQRSDLDAAAVGALVDELLTSQQPFKPQNIGAGPWQVMYSRGPLLWQTLTAPGTLANPDNEFSQEFDAATGRLINKGELLGEKLFITASGSYAVQGQAAQLPIRIVAAVEGGTLHITVANQQVQIPLPFIRGRGEVDLVYVDNDIRIFKQRSGSLTVQVKRSVL